MPQQQPNQQFNIPNSVPQQPVANNAPQQRPPSVVRANAGQVQKPKKQGNPFIIVTWLMFGLLFISIGAIAVISYLNNQEKTDLNDQITTLTNEVERQRNEKNQIRDIWEEQAASNDKIIISQDNFITQVQDYIQEVDKTIRFVDGQFQVLPTGDQQRLEQAKADLDTDLQDLTLTSEESIDLKNANKEKIDTIYLLGFEDQNNRANPDGIR